VTAVRVVVVADSPVQRAHLLDVLEAERDIVVVGQAGDPLEAVALVQRLRPDVVTMDLGLPGEGGLGAIEQIMADVPTPILVLSTRVTCAISAAAVESLLAGAVEALPKPERWDVEAERQLRCRVRLLSSVTVVAHPRGRRRPRAPDPHRAPPVAIAASTGGPAALHRPSADELLASVAATAGGQSVGVLLTGMDDDGAAGLLALRRQGAVTIAQDEATSVVFGMPRAARRLGAAGEVLGLGHIPRGHPQRRGQAGPMSTAGAHETSADERVRG
jgi:chemotaxis response regulator CheB